MKRPALSLKLIQHLYQNEERIKCSSDKENSGYTLIELLVVIIIIGVLAAASAPSWLTFVNQRRVSAANEIILRALQEAQSQAKNKKVSYSVSVKNENGVPAVAVYQAKKSDGTNFPPYNWKSLNQELNLRPGQVLLGTNLSGENQAGSLSYNLSNANNYTITFDYLGALAGDVKLDPNKPLTIAVAVPKNNNSTDPNESIMRCVKVTTLLGAIKVGRGKSDCLPTSSAGS